MQVMSDEIVRSLGTGRFLGLGGYECHGVCGRSVSGLG